MTQTTIRIKQGSYRNKSVAGMSFELVEQFKTTNKNRFVTVRNNGTFPNMPDTIRVNVDSPSDYEFVTGAVSMPIVEPIEDSSETDEQIGRAHV